MTLLQRHRERTYRRGIGRVIAAACIVGLLCYAVWLTERTVARQVVREMVEPEALLR